MKTRIRVWHINNLRMDATVQFLDKSAFTAVADIDPEAPPESMLDEAYGRSQHLYPEPWFSFPGIAKLVDHVMVRSTSVGDVLEVLVGERATCGAIHLVKPVGFERIDPLTPIDWRTAHA